jgi:hypothetical protein
METSWTGQAPVALRAASSRFSSMRFRRPRQPGLPPAGVSHLTLVFSSGRRTPCLTMAGRRGNGMLSPNVNRLSARPLTSAVASSVARLGDTHQRSSFARHCSFRAPHAPALARANMPRLDPCQCRSMLRIAAWPKTARSSHARPSRLLPLVLRAPGNAARWPHTLPSERQNTHEKRNADQRLAAGGMPDRDY